MIAIETVHQFAKEKEKETKQNGTVVNSEHYSRLSSYYESHCLLLRLFLKC